MTDEASGRMLLDMSHGEASLLHRMPPRPLKMRRLALALTQAEVAAAAGLSRAQVIRLETGQCLPTWRSAQQLAATLGVEPHELFPTTSEAAGTSGGSAKTSDAGGDHAER